MFCVLREVNYEREETDLPKTLTEMYMSIQTFYSARTKKLFKKTASTLIRLIRFPKALSRVLITVETEQLFPCQLHDRDKENVTKLYLSDKTSKRNKKKSTCLFIICRNGLIL